MVDITDEVQKILPADLGGVAHLFVKHTTAALTVADLDPGGTDQDYLDALEEMVPKFRRSDEISEVGIPTEASGLQYRHPHDPAHMPDHILSALIGVSLTIPVESGKLVLGTWQRVVLFELDGPRERTVVVY